MKMTKFILRNYFIALAVLLMVLGLSLWLKPMESMELAETLKRSSIYMRLLTLLLINLWWSISFILFDIWNNWRCKIKDSK